MLLDHILRQFDFEHHMSRHTVFARKIPVFGRNISQPDSLNCVLRVAIVKAVLQYGVRALIRGAVIPLFRFHSWHSWQGTDVPKTTTLSLHIGRQRRRPGKQQVN